ncbi:MAG: hypothetical protein MZV70_42560 [Desulfobacterales bacterium]|nr:hypothetical protein [Desulfobacterales bacterium]
MFRYALFAHALGLPKSEEPADAGFHVPRTNTGVGDFPGGDVMVTLGAFSRHRRAARGHALHAGLHADARAGAQHGAAAWRGGVRAQLQADVPERDELPVPAARAARRLRASRTWTSRGQSRSGGKLSDETSLAGRCPGAGCRYRIGWYAPLAGSYLDPR